MTVTLTEHGTMVDDGVEFIWVEVVDGLGVDVFAPEVEAQLPRLIGPTAYLLLRHLIRRYDEAALGDVTPLDEVARSLGVKPPMIRRAIKRCHLFGCLVHQPRYGTVVVSRHWNDGRAGS